jgi:D-alanyl-D-alanine carboxypeptidase (penicillin-binding protein 5/6)
MPSPAVYRRRRQVVFAGASAMFIAIAFAVTTLVAPLPAAAVTLVETPALTQPAAALVLPGYGESAIGADGFGTLATDGPQEQVPIASITKVITALVVLDAKPLADAADPGPTITFSQTDVQILQQTQAEYGSFEIVTDGMQLTQKQALTVMLMVSANNYAVSLATWAYGSFDAYLVAANGWLAAQGLTGTVVDDASGISSGSRSTPTDMLVIGSLVMASPSLAEIVGTQSADIPEVGQILNGNKLLGTEGVNGIKTGTTVDAGATLLYSAVLQVGSESVHVIGVTLGAETHAQLRASVAALLASVRANFHQVVLSTADVYLGSADTVWGSSARFAATESVSRLVYSDTPVTFTTNVTTFSTGSDGASVGSLDVTIGEEIISIPLALSEALEDPGPGWRLTHAGELF